MTLYLDASVVVPLVVVEPTTETILLWLGRQDEELAISRLAIGEVGSAISRRRRMSQLTDAQGAIPLAALDEFLATSATVVDHDASDVAEAAMLVRRPLPSFSCPMQSTSQPAAGSIIGWSRVIAGSRWSPIWSAAGIC